MSQLKKRIVGAIDTLLCFFLDENGELNRNGMILAAIVLFLGLNLVGYIEGGGALPFE